MSNEPQQPRPDYRAHEGSSTGHPGVPQSGQQGGPGYQGGPQAGYAGGPQGGYPGGPQAGGPGGPHGGYPGGPGYGPGPGAPGGNPTGSSGPRDDEKTVAVLTHLAGPIAALVSVGSLGFLGPLIVWFVYKNKSPFLRSAAAGAFNFNVTLWLINVVGWICVFTVILLPVGFILMAAYWVLLFVFHIIAAVKAGHGEAYRYPFQLPILR